MLDPFDLQRFITAQDGAWPAVEAELTAGAKRSHWMWFVFPQLRGLGHSPTALFYGIGSLDEAEAYLAHPLLGERLRHGATLVLGHRGRSATAIFGSPDDLKLRSSMTLFEAAGGTADPVYAAVLDGFFGRERDPRTLRLLDKA
ncbi:DUF1810 domain-containing protein [Bosea sp. TND4EK4]|uniref:DUF1810 domain-containing protein n=1 Tax=Bosea sp. TND4EK4 TaxID=1907408 RepID=UPI0009552970|nr:DUF1810 domain-containing protein [Bosea sp. TND4EK4]SIR57672.1 Uncharacterized protein, DUF1810 family [Bosea sp. TND4EK4]